MLVPWASVAIYIPGLRHPYLKQVIQDAFLAGRLIHTDCLLCFALILSAINCQLPSAHIYRSKRWPARLINETHFRARIHDLFHIITVLRSWVNDQVF